MQNLRDTTDEHRGREAKIIKNMEINHKRLLNTESKLRVAGGVLGGGMG